MEGKQMNQHAICARPGMCSLIALVSTIALEGLAFVVCFIVL
jgi:hypothetical protein